VGSKRIQIKSSTPSPSGRARKNAVFLFTPPSCIYVADVYSAVMYLRGGCLLRRHVFMWRMFTLPSCIYVADL
jgi:hypothetical protein